MAIDQSIIKINFSFIYTLYTYVDDTYSNYFINYFAQIYNIVYIYHFLYMNNNSSKPGKQDQIPN